MRKDKSSGGGAFRRMRQYRTDQRIRDLVAEVRVDVDRLIAPIFVTIGRGVRRAISSMPGQFQFSVDTALQQVEALANKGICSVLLFGIPASKDSRGSKATDPAGPVQKLTVAIKKNIPQMTVVTDVCLCDYTNHGHCGLLQKLRDGRFDVDNDRTLPVLAKIAVSHAAAGADIVAPSAMMDGQVGAIRHGLDAAGFNSTLIMSYSAKFASCFYGPFRQAAECAPKFGDRKTYQMDYRSPSQATVEAEDDIEQGADIIMVKPAMAYLDVIAALRRQFDYPLAAYQVSGEYSSIKFAAAAGVFDERAAVMESVFAIRRAGADLIITYFAEQLADWLR